jgi:serine/threonine protein kinase
LARVHDSKIGESSVAQNVVGSFGYMSPEQLTGKELSTASDIYSLGAIAYEMITGRMPFHPDSVFELYEKQKANELIPPSDLRRDLPLAAQTIVLRSISFNTEKRYSNALDFCNTLSEALLSGNASKSIPSARVAENPPSTIARLLPVVLNLVTFLPFLKFYFSRFVTWQNFLIEPGSLGTLAIALFSALAIRKISVSRKVLATLLLPVAIWLLLILSLPPVIRISNQSGKPPDAGLYTLNYSDPRGYKYTVVESNYCLIEIHPGGFNHLPDYTLQLVLSPPLEFSDVFFDRNFRISNQLLLQPSSTNDILVLRKTGDDFYNIRSIAVRYKYRIREEDNRIIVRFQAGNREISSEQKLPL